MPKSQLNSISDLKKSSIAMKLGRKIQGISAGEMARSKVAVKV